MYALARADTRARRQDRLEGTAAPATFRGYFEEFPQDLRAADVAGGRLHRINHRELGSAAHITESEVASFEDTTASGSKRHWGPIVTLGQWLGAVVPLVLGTLLSMVVWAAITPGVEVGELTSIDMSVVESDGALLAIYGVVSNFLVTAYLILVIRRTKIPVVEYLALRWPSWRDLALGVALLAIFVPLADFVTQLSGRDVVPAFMTDTYATAKAAGLLPLYAFSLIVAAPVAEEIMFRGFLFRGLAQGWGTAAGILIPAALFAMVHTQYELFLLVQILVIAVLFGWLRARSGSLLLTIVLHAMMNAFAFAQVAITAVNT
jgi:membrane protease YdiL (CAAX protease family)